jgi:hypothetical protein
MSAARPNVENGDALPLVRNAGSAPSPAQRVTVLELTWNSSATPEHVSYSSRGLGDVAAHAHQSAMKCSGLCRKTKE